MKAVIIALALFIAPKAFANDCSPYVVPSTANESGTAEWVYPCGMDYKITHRACNEGEVAYDSVLDPTGNFYMQVAVVCRNGSFAAPARNVKHRGCTEGEIAYSSKFNGNFYQNVTVVCRGGRFVRR